MGDVDRLEQLIRAKYPCLIIETYEESYAQSLIRDVTLIHGLDLRVWSAGDGVVDGQIDFPDPVPDTANPAAALVHLCLQLGSQIAVMLDLAAHLEDPVVLRQLRRAIDRFHEQHSTLILIDHQARVPAVISSHAMQFEISLPDEPEIEQVVRDALRSAHRRQKLTIKIGKPQMRAIIRNLRGLTRRQIGQIINETVVDDNRFDAADLNTVMAAKRRLLQGDGLLDYVETPATLDEIGGLLALKRWLKQRRDAFTDHAKAFGIPTPRGILLLGVQGAGKSLCAKAVAAAWQRPLLRLDPGSLYDRYVGESERRLRGCLHQAEMMSPIILWIDEIEKGFAAAASQSTDGGLSRRMFGTLLTWMQEHQSPVFLVATANDIEALPPELLRKGRFDEIFFVDLPKRDARKRIASIHLKKRGRNPDEFDLNAIADACDQYSGAEIEQAVITALYGAFDDRQKLTTEHVVESLRASVPLSVTMAEKVAHLLRAWAEDRTVPAG